MGHPSKAREKKPQKKIDGEKDVTTASSTKPTSTKPSSTKPTSTKPSSTKPTSTKPSSTKPTSTIPASTISASTVSSCSSCSSSSSSTSSLSQSKDTTALIKNLVTRAVEKKLISPSDGIAVYERSLQESVTSTTTNHRRNGMGKQITTWRRTTRESIVKKRKCICGQGREENDVGSHDIVYADKSEYTRSKLVEHCLQEARKNLAKIGYLDKDPEDECEDMGQEELDSRQRNQNCVGYLREDNQYSTRADMQYSRRFGDQCDPKEFSRYDDPCCGPVECSRKFGNQCCTMECPGRLDTPCDCCCCFCQYLEYCLYSGNSCWCCGCDINEASDEECDCDGISQDSKCSCEKSEEIFIKKSNVRKGQKNIRSPPPPPPPTRIRSIRQNKNVNWSDDCSCSSSHDSKGACDCEKTRHKYVNNWDKKSKKVLKQLEEYSCSSCSLSEESSLEDRCNKRSCKIKNMCSMCSSPEDSSSEDNTRQSKKKNRDKKRDSSIFAGDDQTKNRIGRRTTETDARKKSSNRRHSSSTDREKKDPSKCASPVPIPPPIPNPFINPNPTIKFYAEEPLCHPGQTKITLNGPNGVSTYLPANPPPPPPCCPYPCPPQCYNPCCPPMCCPPPMGCPPMCYNPNIETTQYIVS